MTTVEILLAVHCSGACILATVLGELAETRAQLITFVLAAVLWPLTLVAIAVLLVIAHTEGW